MRYFSLIICATALGTCFMTGGCAVVGILGSPTLHEQKVPAQFDLKAYEDRKIVVFVDEVSGANVGLHFRNQVGKAIDTHLVKRVGIEKDAMISRQKIEYLRVNRDNFSLMSPAEVGREVGAGLVLYVLLEDYELYGMAEQSYYTGLLYSRSVLFDSETGKVVWPSARQGHVVESVVELELQMASAQERLASATAQSITNKLFDCPYDETKVGDLRDEGYNW